MEPNISAYATICDVRHVFAVGGGPKSKELIVDALNGSSEFSSALNHCLTINPDFVSPAPEVAILHIKNFPIYDDCFEKEIVNQ